MTENTILFFVENLTISLKYGLSLGPNLIIKKNRTFVLFFFF